MTRRATWRAMAWLPRPCCGDRAQARAQASDTISDPAARAAAERGGMPAHDDAAPLPTLAECLATRRHGLLIASGTHHAHADDPLPAGADLVGRYVRIVTWYPVGTQVQRLQQLSADALGVPYDPAQGEVAVVRVSHVDARDGYLYVTWHNEQPAQGAPRVMYDPPGRGQRLVGYDPRLGSHGAFRHYTTDTDRLGGTTIVAVLP